MKTLFTHSCRLVISAYLLASAISASAEVGNIIHRVHPLTSTEVIESSPAIGPDGTVYFTTRDPNTSSQMLGTIYAVDGSSGAIIAHPPMNRIKADGIMSSPAIGPDGAVIFGNGNRVTKYTLHLSSKLWDSDVFQPGGGNGVDQANFMCTPTLGPESPPKIYVAADDATYCDSGVFALDYNSGERSGGHIFNFNRSLIPANQLFADVDSSLAISSGGIVYMIGEHQDFVAAADSSKSFNCDSQQPPMPVWLASVHTVMDNVDAGEPDGSVHTRFQLTHFNSSPAISADGTVYVGAREGVCAIGRLGDVALFSPRTTAEDLQQLRSFRSSPAIGSDGTVYIGCDNGKFYAIQPAGFGSVNGYLKWTFTPDWTPAPNFFTSDGTCEHRPPIISSPAISADGTVYITASTESGQNLGNGREDMNDNAVLYALDANTGAIKWKTKLDGVLSPSSPAIASDGTIWVGDMTTMYAIQGSSPLDPNAPWPMYHHDNAHTGRQNAGSCPGVQGLTAVPSFQTVTLSWSSIGSGSTYTIKRASGGSSVFTTLATGWTGTSYVDGNNGNNTLQGFSTYYYVVESSCGPSSASTPVKVTTLPIVVNVQFGDGTLPAPPKSGTAAARVGSSGDIWNVPNVTFNCFGGVQSTGPGSNLVDRTGTLVQGAQPLSLLIHADFGESCLFTTPTLAPSGTDPLFQFTTAQNTGHPIFVQINGLPDSPRPLVQYLHHRTLHGVYSLPLGMRDITMWCSRTSKCFCPVAVPVGFYYKLMPAGRPAFRQLTAYKSYLVVWSAETELRDCAPVRVS